MNARVRVVRFTRSMRVRNGTGEMDMSDRDVEREIEANKQREMARDRAEEDDGPVVDTAERIVDPLAKAIGTNYDEEREGVE
jgi:hypothetical protein